MRKRWSNTRRRGQQLLVFAVLGAVGCSSSSKTPDPEATVAQSPGGRVNKASIEVRDNVTFHQTGADPGVTDARPSCQALAIEELAQDDSITRLASPHDPPRRHAAWASNQGVFVYQPGKTPQRIYEHGQHRQVFSIEPIKQHGQLIVVMESGYNGCKPRRSHCMPMLVLDADLELLRHHGDLGIGTSWWSPPSPMVTTGSRWGLLATANRFPDLGVIEFAADGDFQRVHRGFGEDSKLDQLLSGYWEDNTAEHVAFAMENEHVGFVVQGTSQFVANDHSSRPYVYVWIDGKEKRFPNAGAPLVAARWQEVRLGALFSKRDGRGALIWLNRDLTVDAQVRFEADEAVPPPFDRPGPFSLTGAAKRGGGGIEQVRFIQQDAAGRERGAYTVSNPGDVSPGLMRGLQEQGTACLVDTPVGFEALWLEGNSLLKQPFQCSSSPEARSVQGGKQMLPNKAIVVHGHTDTCDDEGVTGGTTIADHAGARTKQWGTKGNG